MKLLFGFLVVALAGVAASLSHAKDSPFTFRAIWVDTGSYLTQEATDRLIVRCQRAKLNVLLPCVMAHGSLLHKSSRYLHNVVANEKFDPLSYLIDKAHAVGMEVHAWYCVYYEGAKGLSPGKPEWICSDFDGVRMEDALFLSPQIPGVNEYLLSIIEDGLAYNLDGIHLDYIRYYGTAYDYSEPGRAPFIKSAGFDPIDFLDHTEQIASANEDPFPVRVLHPERHKTRPWENSWTESLMDRSGIGFGFISEKPENVDALRVPGALILNCYNDPSPGMAEAFERYVDRGGNLLWLNAVASEEHPGMANLFGVGVNHNTLPAKRGRFLKPVGSHPVARRIPKDVFCDAGYSPSELDGGTAVAAFDSGEPAIVVNHHGAGRTALVGFNPAVAFSESVAMIPRSIIDWFRKDSGVKSKADPLAWKRAQWIDWRKAQVSSMVERTHDLVKAKNRKLAISVAGGLAPSESYLCFKDGRHWLKEGWLDFAVPMDYCDGLEDLRQLLETHRALVPRRKRSMVYPGLGLYTSKAIEGKKTTTSQDATILREQIGVVRDMGYKGFALFCTQQLTDEQIPVIAEFAP